MMQIITSGVQASPCIKKFTTRKKVANEYINCYIDISGMAEIKCKMFFLENFT